MSRKKFLFVSAEKGDLKLTGDEHKVIRDLFPDDHQFVQSIREAYVAFPDLFNLFENNRDNNKNPDIEILHFAGHSGKEGLLFDADATGNGIVTIEKFKEFISWYPNLKIIILNSCVSNYIGEKLKEIVHIEVIIETTDTIYERDAILFTQHLYTLLNNGDEIVNAFGKVQLMFETGNISITDRGNKREIKGRKIKNNIFPWNITTKENSKWKLFDKIPDNSTDKEIKILHFYINNDQNDFAKSLDTSLRSVYAKLNDKTDLRTKVFTSEDFLNIEGDFKKLEHFDSVIFFLTEGFYDQFQALNIKEFYTDNCKVSVVNCSGNESEISIIKDNDIEIIEDLIFPKINFFSVKMLFETKGGSLTSFLEETFITELKILNSKQALKNSLIEKELDEKFEVLNFNKQVIIGSDISKYNFFVLEGTEKCAHELLVRRILTLANINSPISHFHEFAIKEADVSSFTLESFWSTLFDEIVSGGFSMNRKLSCVEAIVKQAHIKDVVILLNYKCSDPLFFKLVYNFWTEFREALNGHEIKHRFFFFVLNKRYCSDTCAWEIESSFKDKHYSNKFLDPISFLPLQDLETWFSINLKNLNKLPLYNSIKDELNEIFQEHSPMGEVVETICNKFELENYHERILSINDRYEK